MKTTNRLFISFALFIIAAPLFSQDYSASLEGITKVVISAETTIVIKQHDKVTFLITEAENYKNPIIKKAKGLKAINSRGNDNTNYGVEVTKEGSLLVVKGLRERREANLVIYLPKTINISVESLANNEIYIDGFSSEIEAINYHGNTTLLNVTGPIITENNNGNITIKFYKLYQLSPTSIVAENGDIDIRMPEDTNANITSKTPRGEFYTDFNLNRTHKNSTKRNRRSIKEKLNNGGVDINLQNLKGNIYLRKLK